jgi:DUF1365 family protein
MDQRYAWRFRFAPHAVAIHMVNHQRIEGVERTVFDAALSVSLAPMTPARLLRHLLSWPLMTVRVVWGIYFQALRLQLKHAPFFTHAPVRPS